MTKYLVIADDNPESAVAMRYAARCIRRPEDELTLLAVVRPVEFQYWNALMDTMISDTREKLTQYLESSASYLQSNHGVNPRIIKLEGDPVKVITTFVSKEENLGALVLGIDSGPNGPGKLIRHFSHQSSGSLNVPLILVPGHMTDENLRNLF